MQKDHDAEWEFVFAANRSAQLETQRAEALVEASGSTPRVMGRGPDRPVKTRVNTWGA